MTKQSGVQIPAWKMIGKLYFLLGIVALNEQTLQQYLKLAALEISVLWEHSCSVLGVDAAAVYKHRWGHNSALLTLAPQISFPGKRRVNSNLKSLCDLSFKFLVGLGEIYSWLFFPACSSHQKFSPGWYKIQINLMGDWSPQLGQISLLEMKKFGYKKL